MGMGANKTRIFDLHCDTLDRLGWQMLDSDLRGVKKSYVEQDAKIVGPGELMDFASAPTHLSLERAQAYDWAQCLAVFIPDTLDIEQSARFFTCIAGTLERHVAAHPSAFAQVRSVAEVEPALKAGKLAGLLTIENGKLLAASPSMPDTIAAAGVKMVTLTWNAANPLGSGNETQEGLSAFGRQMVAALEERHIAVDVSHLNDPGFWDVVACAKRPFAASHSNAREVCGHPRNLTDEQFRAIRDAGGVAGLNFCRKFVSDDADPSCEQLLAHVDRWLDLDGADAVAIGSDYDGCDVPSWLEGCERMETLADAVRTRYGAELAEKLLFKNAYDFFARVERG